MDDSDVAGVRGDPTVNSLDGGQELAHAWRVVVGKVKLLVHLVVELFIIVFFACQIENQVVWAMLLVEEARHFLDVVTPISLDSLSRDAHSNQAGEYVPNCNHFSSERTLCGAEEGRGAGPVREVEIKAVRPVAVLVAAHKLLPVLLHLALDIRHA